jgi:autoinducer 2-degrading protein
LTAGLQGSYLNLDATKDILMSAFVLMVHLQTKPEHRDQFMEMALENAAAARSSEPGCQQFDVVIDAEDRNRIAFYEVYESKEAFEAHLETPHFRKYLEHAVPLLVSRERSFFDRVAP